MENKGYVLVIVIDDELMICEPLSAYLVKQGYSVLTAKTLDENTINGLNIGADDYVTKPFSVKQSSKSFLT